MNSYSFEEILEVTSSKRVHAKDYVEKGIPFYRSKEAIQLANNEEITDVLHISEEHFSTIKSKYNVPEIGDILLTSVGTIGVPFYVTNPEFYFKDGNLTWFRDFSEKINSRFLYYWMQSSSFKTQIKNNNIGAVQKALTIDFLKTLQIDVPEQQVEITKVLSDLDKKIELNNKINTELEAMAKLIYDYWFVQFDFPDANGKPYKTSGGKMVYNETLKREIPDGWSDGHCSDLFSFNPTLSIKKGTVSSHIDMNALPTSGFMTKKIKLKPFSGGMKFQNGDVVIARITPCLENGKTGLISLLDKNEIGFGSTEFIVLRGKYFDLRCFGSCLARSEKFRKHAISKMTGTSGRKRVNYNALEQYVMALPSKKFLKIFEEKIAPFFEKMTSNTKENEELVKLRDWLLPMLMNGQVTVNDSSPSA